MVAELLSSFMQYCLKIGIFRLKSFPPQFAIRFKAWMREKSVNDALYCILPIQIAQKAVII